MLTLLLVLIGLFSLHRCLLAATTLLRGRGPARVPPQWPSVAVVLVSRDEEAALDECLAALAALRYPADRCHLFLVSDGSLDGTSGRMRDFAKSHPGTQVMALQVSVGKAQALNCALAELPSVDFVAVYDTDLRPHPDSLQQLVTAACADARTAAAGGVREPMNRHAGLVAAYAALECDVHQWVTLRGRHLLGWNPPTTGGNCVYRRAALADVGGFTPGALSEDVEVSMAMAAAGWRTVFVELAVAASTVADSWRQFTRQRLRWSSGLYASAKRAKGWQSWLTAAGYFDRVLFLCAAVAVGVGLLHPAWLLFYLIPPLLTVVAAQFRSGHLRELTKSLAAATLLFPWDVCLASWGALARLGGHKPIWQPAASRAAARRKP